MRLDWDVCQSRNHWYGKIEGSFFTYKVNGVAFSEVRLHKGGCLGFICSDRFLLTNYGAPLREHLPREAQVRLLLDLRDSKVFQQALNYPAIFVVRRGPSKRPNVFPAGRAFSDPEDGGIGILFRVLANALCILPANK